MTWKQKKSPGNVFCPPYLNRPFVVNFTFYRDFFVNINDEFLVSAEHHLRKEIKENSLLRLLYEGKPIVAFLCVNILHFDLVLFLCTKKSLILPPHQPPSIQHLHNNSHRVIQQKNNQLKKLR